MSSAKEQLDLFVALVGDVPLRDDREMMSAPMVSIAKRGQERIEWTGPSGQEVLITSTAGDDIATIIAAQKIPTYELIEERSANGDPLMRMRYRKLLL